MTCLRSEIDPMRYLDGVMSPREREEFERHLEVCKDCAETVRRFEELDKITRRVKMKDPTDEFWQSYWKSLYRRIERRVAWIFILIGTAIFAVYAVYETIRSFKELTWDKIAAVFILIGVLLLIISVVRERYHQYKVDRYKDIKR